MSEVLDWLKEYSPAAVLLIAVVAAAIFFLKLVVEKTIAIGFDTQAKLMEMLLQRRSAFEEKVLADRFALITGLSARLEKVMTNLNRIRSGQPFPDGFMQQNEVVPLTEIFEDLSVHRLILGEDFHDLFWRKSQLALKAANTLEPQEWADVGKDWIRLQQEIRVAAEGSFGISRIRW